MSRIDEALARSRNLESLPPLPPPVEPAGDATLAFPAEGGAAAPVEAAASVELGERAASEDAMDAPVNFQRLPLAEKLVLASATSSSVEQYRRLAGRLHLVQAEQGTRIVMVTSALPGEGKTLSATNLALTLSESYKRQVLLIDADLRRPCIHHMFQVPNAAGLNDGLRAVPEGRIPIIRYTEHLSILTAGRPESDPMSVLSSERMRHVLQEAGSQFEWVIIDTPPVALLTDAHLLASLVETVLLVVQAGRTPLPAIKTAIEAVGREKVLGIVLNRADKALAHGRAYDYYGSYYSSARV